MAEVYARRWDVEMAMALIKQHLKLRLLWSAKRVVILQQTWATLTISQVLRSMRLEIAHKAGADPLQIFVERGRQLGFIRPSRRTRIRAPRIPVRAIQPAPRGLSLIRTPRYANRKGSRPGVEAAKVN